MTPQQRADKLLGGLTSCQVLIWDVAAAIRQAENDALERAAAEAERTHAEFTALCIRKLKHTPPSSRTD